MKDIAIIVTKLQFPYQRDCEQTRALRRLFASNSVVCAILGLVMLMSNLSPVLEYFNIFLRMFIFLKLQCNGETTLANDNLPFSPEVTHG